jgi:hypothetical protein
MAFDKTNLDVRGSSKGTINIHTYQSSADAVITIEGASYFTFDEVGGVMEDGDLIYYVGTDGGKLAAISNSGTAISIKAITLYL